MIDSGPGAPGIRDGGIALRRPHRAAHSAIWAGLAIAIPGLLIAAFVLRQDLQEREAPQRLEAPQAAGEAATGAAAKGSEP